MFKANNKDSNSGVFIVNFDRISSVSIVYFEHAFVCWLGVFLASCRYHRFTKRELLWDPSVWRQHINWTYTRRPENVLDGLWTSYVRSVYVLCPGGAFRFLKKYWPDSFTKLILCFIIWSRKNSCSKFSIEIRD